MTDIYYSNGNEVQLFERAYQQRLPVMLTGPTGCGKTRLVEHMGLLLSRPVVTISCHDDLTSSDLVGRFMVTGGDVVWTDGPLTRAVKAGAICYLDEVVEARHDSLAILHSLTDHRRALYLDRADEVVTAPETFMLVCSYNPAYRSSLKELKPSFRQRFVTLPMRYLPADREAEVIVAEAGIELSVRGKAGCLRHRHPDRRSRLPLRAAVHPSPGHRGTADRSRRNRIGGSRGMHPRAAVDRRRHQRRLARGRRRQSCRRRQLAHASLAEPGKESTTMDQKERQRKKALIILQIVIYGYLLLMFGIQLYMSFARGWWESVNLPLLNRHSDDPVSLEDHHDESRLAQRRADKWMIVGAALMGMWAPGLIGFPIFMRGVWLQRQALRAGLSVRPMIVTLIGYLVLIDGALNSLGWALDLVANHTLINRVLMVGWGNMFDAGYFWHYNELWVGGAAGPGEKAYVAGLILTVFAMRCAAAIGFLQMKRWGHQWMVITCWMGVVIWCAYVFNMTMYADVRYAGVVFPVIGWWLYDIFYITPFLAIPYLHTVNREIFTD